MPRLLLTLLVLSLYACIQMPTQDNRVIEEAAYVAFIAPKNRSLEQLTVSVNGLDYGLVTQYAQKYDGEALRILPGLNIVEVFHNNQLVLKQKVHIPNGVTKEILVK